MKKTKEKFLRLREAWIKETAHISSIHEMAMHPAYQEIIGMGEKVIPYLIHDQKQNNTHWFWALHSIVGENPIDDDHRGNIPKMAEDWYQWWMEKMEFQDPLEKHFD